MAPELPTVRVLNRVLIWCLLFARLWETNGTVSRKHVAREKKTFSSLEVQGWHIEFEFAVVGISKCQAVTSEKKEEETQLNKSYS